MDKKPQSIIKTASFMLSHLSFAELLVEAKKLDYDIAPEINPTNFNFPHREKSAREAPVRFFCTNFVDGQIAPDREIVLVNSKQVIDIMSQQNCVGIDFFRLMMIITAPDRKFTREFKSMAALGSSLKMPDGHECVPVVTGRVIHLVSNEVNWGLRWCFPALPKPAKK